MRARNIIIILVVQYIIMVILSVYLEIHSLSRKSQEVLTMIRTAADLALEQAQLIDDYMAYAGRPSYQLKMPSSNGNGFIPVDMFAGIYGKDSRVEANKEWIFDKLYNTNELKMLATRLDAMRKPVKYWDQSGFGFTWYYLPRAALLGLDILPDDPAIRRLKDVNGNYVDKDFSEQVMLAYGLDKHTKISDGKSYYNTPINVGITYINEDLLGTLFVNNMDLLMRQKYTANLETPEGGNGVLKGSTFANKLKEGNIDRYNPINNGSFTFLRGQQNPSDPAVKSFSGVKPLVVYKVIDMYDPANDDMLIALFGANKGGFATKAEYLKDLDKNVINPATGRPYDKKPIVVAKVTFYADVIIPYFSVITRELRSTFGKTGNNFIDLAPDSPTGVEGARRISYTRYFAITP